MFYNKHVFVFNFKDTLKLWEFYYKAKQILLKICRLKTGKMWFFAILRLRNYCFTIFTRFQVNSHHYLKLVFGSPPRRWSRFPCPTESQICKSTLIAELAEGSCHWTKPWAIPIPRDSESPPPKLWGSPTEGQWRRKNQDRWDLEEFWEVHGPWNQTSLASNSGSPSYCHRPKSSISSLNTVYFLWKENGQSKRW